MDRESVLERFRGWRNTEAPSPEIALTESAWSRARREGRARCLTLSFLIVEVVLSYLAGSTLSPGIGVLMFFALIGAVFLSSLAIAPVQQRNEVRRTLIEKETSWAADQRTAREVKIVEDELSIALLEAEVFFVTDTIGIEVTEDDWIDWRKKTGAFLGVALGHAKQTAFDAVGVRLPFLEFVKRDRDQLIGLSERLSSDDIRSSAAELEKAAGARRENKALKRLAAIGAAEKNRQKQIAEAKRASE